MMKKTAILLSLAVALGLSSCSSVKHTAATAEVNTTVISRASADLQVSQKKISYTMRPTRPQRRCGEKAVIESAVAAALKENGNADVLVAMQYEIKKTKNFFGKKSIKYVLVEGYPATYTNITPLEPCPKPEK